MRKNTALFFFILFLFFNFISTAIPQQLEETSLLLANSPDSLKLALKTLSFDNTPDFANHTKVVTATYKNEYFTPQQVRHDRLTLAGLMLISLNYAAYQPFKDAWWQEERTHFHFYRGWRRNKGHWDFGWNDTLFGHIDKLGHFYSAKLLSEHIYSISRWIGFDEHSSKWIGPILGSLLMLEIEIYDGFFKDWGFSLADFTANELGAFSPLIKEKIPFSKNFQLKLSYHDSNQHNQEDTFIKDYAGMTFWISYNVQSLLPASVKNYYPGWLNLALGYSVSKPTRGKVELYLAPDINWMKVPWGRSPSAIFIKKMLNNFHFPCFSLKLMPDKRFYPIYF